MIDLDQLNTPQSDLLIMQWTASTMMQVEEQAELYREAGCETPEILAALKCGGN